MGWFCQNPGNSIFPTPVRVTSKGLHWVSPRCAGPGAKWYEINQESIHLFTDLPGNILTFWSQSHGGGWFRWFSDFNWGDSYVPAVNFQGSTNIMPSFIPYPHETPGTLKAASVPEAWTCWGSNLDPLGDFFGWKLPRVWSTHDWWELAGWLKWDSNEHQQYCKNVTFFLDFCKGIPHIKMIRI